MSQYRTKEFRALQAEWYKKLKDSGFRDIETSKKLGSYDGTYHNTAQIKNQLSGRERRTLREVNVVPTGSYSKEGWIMEAKDREEYFYRLRSHVHRLPRNAPKYLKEAFEQYSEGKTMAAIVRAYTKEIREFIKKHEGFAVKADHESS